MYDSIQQSFEKYGEGILTNLPHILSGIGILIIAGLIGVLFKRISRRIALRRTSQSILSTFVGQIFQWLFIIIGFLFALHQWGFGGFANSLLAGAGISAIIVGFAFKDIAENFLSGIILAFNRPFQLGDVIEVNGNKGPVRDLELRTTHIRVADGRDIWIPNSMIVKGALINYTRDGLLRQEFMVGIDPADEAEKARKLIIDLLIKDPLILDHPSPNVFIDKLGVSTVDLKVMFWVDVKKHQQLMNEMNLGESARSKSMREVKDLLLDNDFNLPGYVVEHKILPQTENWPVELVSREAV